MKPGTPAGRSLLLPLSHPALDEVRLSPPALEHLSRIILQRPARFAFDQGVDWLGADEYLSRGHGEAVLTKTREGWFAGEIGQELLRGGKIR